MDLTNLKLLQALSGMNPYQGQDENSFNAPPMAKDDMFSQMFQPQVQPQMQSQSLSNVQQPDYGMSMTAQNKLAELLANQPRREDYKPGFMTKLGSGLVSITDPRLADQMLNRGFNQANDAWEQQLGPIKELATIERADNTNKRLIETQRQRNENEDLKREQAAKTAEERNATQRENIAQKDRFLAYKYYKDSHPNKVFKSDSEGKVYSIDPQSGHTEYVTDADGEIIHDSKLPEMERLQIQQNNRLAAQENQGKITRTNQANQGAITRTNQENASGLRIKEAGVRGNEARKTKVTVPGKAASTPGNEKRVKVTSPDGKTGTVPESQLARAIKSGYKVN